MTAETAGAEESGAGWSALAPPHFAVPLAVLLGGILLHSMNVLLLATLLPGIVEDLSGSALISWPTTAFLASSIMAATCTGRLAAWTGARRIFCAGVLVFGTGALLCALAASMHGVIAGRFVQGFGGGLLNAVAFVLVRQIFPVALWKRVFALLAGIWSVSILVGPLAGGLFARYGSWRMAFFAITAIALLLCLAAFFTLPRRQPTDQATAQPRRLPGLRLLLIVLAIAALSLAGVMAQTWSRAALVALGLLLSIVMLRLDRRAPAPLLPSDAFSSRSAGGFGMWPALLLSLAIVPLQIFMPTFLQNLHGFDALEAGYITAIASLAWTGASVLVSGAKASWTSPLTICGPAVMATGLLGIALTMPAGPVPVLFLAFALTGTGIGLCWPAVAHLVMSSGRADEKDIAASSVATVQQIGFAFGAALAGLVANAVGFSVGQGSDGIAEAAFWVPVFFSIAPWAAMLCAVRLSRMGHKGTVPPR